MLPAPQARTWGVQPCTPVQCQHHSLKYWHLQPSIAGMAHRKARASLACRCQSREDKPKSFLKQVGEWGLRIFGGKAKRRLPAQKLEQQQRQQQQQQPPTEAESDPPPLTTWQPPRPSLTASQQAMLDELTQQTARTAPTELPSTSAQALEQSTVDTVLRQMHEAITTGRPSGKDGKAGGSEPERLKEWWRGDQPVFPVAPAAGAAWEDWQEFIAGTDTHAFWARHVTDEIEEYLSQDEFELASNAQQKLDKAVQHDVVQSVVKEFEAALKDQDYAKAAHLRDAGAAGLLGWWYAVGEDSSTTGGHLLQIVAEPHHCCYAGYMVTASDLCTIEAHETKSMISGELGAWHASMAQSQSQDSSGGGLIIQAQEVQEQGSEPQEPPTIDDFGHPILELYIVRDADGQLRQQATALQHTPREFETEEGVTVLSPDELQPVGMAEGLMSGDPTDSLKVDVQELDHGGTMVSVRFGSFGSSSSTDANSSTDASASADASTSMSANPSTDVTSSAESPSTTHSQADSSDIGSRSQERLQRLLSQLRQHAESQMQGGEAGSSGQQPAEQSLGGGDVPEGFSEVFMDGPMHMVQVGEMVSSDDDEDVLSMVRPHRLKASLVQLDRNSFKLNVLEERSTDEATSAPLPSSASQPEQQPSAAGMQLSDMALKTKEHVLQNLKLLTENSDGPEFQKLVQRLGKAIHMQNSSISLDSLNSIVRGILLHALQSAVGALSEPVTDPAQEIAMHGLTGSTQYRRVPVDPQNLDPFSGVFLDPFNSKGAELYLLERAKGEDGQDSMTAVKITSTENVSAGSVAFKASLAPQKRMPTRGFNEELSLSGRYKAQCRLANADSLNARWDDAELLQFSSSAMHAADLGLMTGGSGSGHQVAWLKRMHLPPPKSATISST